MQVELLFPGSYCMAKIALKSGEAFRAESGAMVAMSESVEVEGKAEGGMVGMFKRAFTGESLFLQTLKASRGDGEVFISPSEPGDVNIIELNGANDFFLQKGGFLAAENGVNIEAVSQGFFKGIMSGEGMFIQKASGKGKLLISSFGGIYKISLAPGQKYVVDNGHLVAWSHSVQYEVKKAAGGWMSSLTSGEGFACHITGPGDVYFQTRNPTGFGAWVRQFIPAKG
ncbi:MAG: TIGR00266 family protein [Candidatus Riflebacteria bacterium]|nr:TIGR00266 family protein [Candidatus Riflebacteria bacterium]